MDSVDSRRSSQSESYRGIVEDPSQYFPRHETSGRNLKLQTDFSGLQYGTENDPELARMATTLSGEIDVTGEKLGSVDPRLDPENVLFDFRFWATKFLQLVKEDGIKRAAVGFTFKNLSVFGAGASLETQKTVGSPFAALLRLPELFHRRPKQEKQILSRLNGTIKSGEMLIVLGRPGSGCTTFLKTICGHQRSLDKSKDSSIRYDGIPQDVFVKEFKGQVVYNQENDEHFPHLTVGQTLHFAAAARTPQARIKTVTREVFSKHLAEVMMRIFGLTHTRNTKVGNDTVRGVSGGERKRVSIAEMALARSSVAAWDNSTRGLDAATALEFVRSLRTAADIARITQAVALYQASQSIYDLFDKTMVLYEGHQIYFGPAVAARAYFENMGWYCPPRQTTPDFLTSVTNPSERESREGYVNKLPRTAEEFEQYWLNSDEYKACTREIQEEEEQALGDDHLTSLREAHHQAQAKHMRRKSPYIISIRMQMRLCTKRACQLLWNDRASTVALAVGRVVLSLIIGSIYYGPPPTTASFSSRGSVIFLSVLLNALLSVTEIGALYAKRPIVEKQSNFAFYHPFADALAGIVVDIPLKFIITTLFNIIFYFLAGLRSDPSNFFIFLMFNFFCTLLMSAVFRSIGASMKEISQAYAIAGIAILAMIIYTGFTLQTTYMHPWFRWINWINPIAYVFEALLVNEVHGRDFPCAPPSVIPPYATGNKNFACAVIGAVPGQRTVSGDNWVMAGYGYSYSHIWRNLGILLAFMVAFYTLYLVATELNSSTNPKPQRLVFRNRQAAESLEHGSEDLESTSSNRSNTAITTSISVEEKLERQTNITSTSHDVGDETTKRTQTISDQAGALMWRDMTLDINIQGESRRLLDHVSGWVKPGTLTCLMGISGAGKTTLLDVLAQRHNRVGVLSGDVFVNGAAQNPSFQRKTGYVQQQDLHIETSTVREALRFSALLRQPPSVPPEEKHSYVEKIIEMLNMEGFSEAIIGNPGEGLNLEQRKLLTIGVELAAKPSILFLDEPTSGLDSQSSWTIIAFLRKLADSGQAVLSTIHQPSAVLFEQFDSLLLMAKGGRTAYFGRIGKDCRTLNNYFEKAGARPCREQENPAEYILEVIGNSASDWPEVWKTSQEHAAFQTELGNVHTKHSTALISDDDKQEFALPFASQFYHVARRVFQQYWRTPSYIYAKFQAAILSALFIGFTFFLQNSSATGMQNTVFAIFMLNATFSTVVNQVSIQGLHLTKNVSLILSRLCLASYHNVLYLRPVKLLRRCTLGSFSFSPTSWSRFRTNSSCPS